MKGFLPTRALHHLSAPSTHHLFKKSSIPAKRFSVATRHLVMGSALVFPLFASNAASQAATATISSSPQQTFKGWGAFPAISDGGSTGTNGYGDNVHTLVNVGLGSRNQEVVDAVYNVGFDYMRVGLTKHMRNSDGSTNTTRFNELKAHLKQGRDRGITKWLPTMWDYPAAFVAVDTISGKNYLKDTEINNFVSWYVARIQDLANDGNGNPAAVFVLNEPDYSDLRYTLNDTTKTTYRTVTKALRVALNNASMTNVPILGPDGADSSANTSLLGSFQTLSGQPVGSGGYAHMESDTDFKNAIGGFSTHTYNHLDVAQHLAAQNRYGKPRWMTEWSIDRNQTTQQDHMIWTMRHLGADLIDLRSEYWFWWLGFHQTNANDGQTLVYAEYGSDKKPQYMKYYWTLQKLFKTVRPDWVVKRVAEDDADLKGNNDDVTSNVYRYTDIYAFENPGGSASAMVLVNPTASAKSFNINGLKGSSATVY